MYILGLREIFQHTQISIIKDKFFLNSKNKNKKENMKRKKIRNYKLNTR